MLSRNRRCPSANRNVERDRRFAGAAQPGDDDHLVARDREIDVFEIVLARAVNMDRAVSSRIGERTRHLGVLPFGILA
jgi:hypothetical protein